MRVRLRFFASLREAAGTSELQLDVPRGATTGDVLRILGQQHAALRDLPAGLLISVNLEYVGPDYRLNEGDEVALIPPVSGGHDVRSAG